VVRSLFGTPEAFESIFKSKALVRRVSLNVTSLAIEQLPHPIRDDVEEYLKKHPRSPAARLRPKIGMAGDLWLVFIGPELREGTSGLGRTPRDALEDFNLCFMEPRISRNGSGPA
jgi:hypothetical protein